MTKSVRISPLDELRVYELPNSRVMVPLGNGARTRTRRTISNVAQTVRARTASALKRAEWHYERARSLMLSSPTNLKAMANAFEDLRYQIAKGDLHLRAARTSAVEGGMLNLVHQANELNRKVRNLRPPIMTSNKPPGNRSRKSPNRSPNRPKSNGSKANKFKASGSKANGSKANGSKRSRKRSGGGLWAGLVRAFS